jgi:lipopolysaccharide heptosyltransferase I
MSKDFKNILLIKPSSLGDVVKALPALSALHTNFSAAKISWLIRPEFAGLVEKHPHLTETILFDRKFLGKAWFHPRALLRLLSLIRQLRRSEFDLVIDLQGLFRTASLGWLSGCKKRFGMANAREFAPVFYTDKIEEDEDCVYVVDYYLKIVRAAGASETQVRFLLPVDSDTADSTERLLESYGIKSDKYAVFVPASAHKSKCWPACNFASLAEMMAAKFGLSIILVGTEPERPITEEIVSASNVKVTDFAGLTTLQELVALLKRARVVVSNDTGPGHIAAALGVPMAMIFGPSNPVRLFPHGRDEKLVAVDPFGRGLELQSSDPAHAIDAITVDEVYKKVCEQIA